MLIEFVYIPHAHISDFLTGEQEDLDNLGTYIRIWHTQKEVQVPTIKNHLKHTW
jgi:hypothetical protein